MLVKGSWQIRGLELSVKHPKGWHNRFILSCNNRNQKKNNNEIITNYSDKMKINRAVGVMNLIEDVSMSVRI